MLVILLNHICSKTLFNYKIKFSHSNSKPKLSYFFNSLFNISLQFDIALSITP